MIRIPLYGSHDEPETSAQRVGAGALVRLYAATGDKKYLDQAKFFLDVRGTTACKDSYLQSHKPVLEQEEAVGHAVRTGYMYSGMADVSASKDFIIFANCFYITIIFDIYMKQLITTFLLSCAIGAQAQHVMTVDVSRPTAKIQPTMYGIFFEDINFGADGGLYAELVKNRSFEFPQPFVGWMPFGNVTVQDAEPCFDRNPHYVRIVNDGRLLRAGLDNEGFRGIGLKQGEEYRFTAYTRTPDARPMKLSVELVNSNGEKQKKKDQTKPKRKYQFSNQKRVWNEKEKCFLKKKKVHHNPEGKSRSYQGRA